MIEQRFKITKSLPTAKEYLVLRKKLSWETYSSKDAKRALDSSLFCVAVYENDTIIGMGRIVGDECLCFYIQDIMVSPAFQNQGVGTLIMKHILTYLNQKAVKGAYIGLMSKKDKEYFYEKFGFVSRPNNTMGCGMIIPNFRPIT